MGVPPCGSLLVIPLFPSALFRSQGLKMIINEKFGDGIMSAIDFYLTVDKVSASRPPPAQFPVFPEGSGIALESHAQDEFVVPPSCSG